MRHDRRSLKSVCHSNLNSLSGNLSRSKTTSASCWLSRKAIFSSADRGRTRLTTFHMLRCVHPEFTTYIASNRPGKLLCPTDKTVGRSSTSILRYPAPLASTNNTNPVPSAVESLSIRLPISRAHQTQSFSSSSFPSASRRTSRRVSTAIGRSVLSMKRSGGRQTNSGD